MTRRATDAFLRKNGISTPQDQLNEWGESLTQFNAFICDVCDHDIASVKADGKHLCFSCWGDQVERQEQAEANQRQRRIDDLRHINKGKK